MAIKLYYVYLLILGLSVIASLRCFNKIDNPSKLISILLFFAFATEITALLLVNVIKVKNPAYHIYSIVELFLTTVYFLKTIKPRNIKTMLILAALICPAIGLLNMRFQSIKTINSYMLIFECFTIICMSIYALYRILLDETVLDTFKYPHFWFWASFLLYWSGSFFYWAFLISIVQSHSKFGEWVSIWQVVINIILYLGIGVTFLLYPKPVSK